MSNFIPVYDTEILASAFALPCVMADSMEASMLMESLPTEINGKPVHYKWRKVVKDGELVHPQKKWRLQVTPDRRASWETTFRQMSADGVRVPVVKDHKMSSESTLGYVYDVRNSGEWWEELHGYIGDESLDIATKNYLSTGLRFMNMAGNGKVYGEGIFHCATTPSPLQTGQPLQMEASSVSGFDTLQNLAYVLDEDKKEMTFTFSQEQLSALQASLGVTEVTAEALFAKATAPAPEPTIVTKEVLASSVVNPELAEARSEVFGERLELLTAKGKITPALAKKLKVIGAVLGKFNGELLASTEVEGVDKDTRLDKQLLDALADLPDVLASGVTVQADPSVSDSDEERQRKLGLEMAKLRVGSK
jgi:hypothetical protein